jgi:hypothetical protein
MANADTRVTLPAFYNVAIWSTSKSITSAGSVSAGSSPLMVARRGIACACRSRPAQSWARTSSSCLANFSLIGPADGQGQNAEHEGVAAGPLDSVWWVGTHRAGSEGLAGKVGDLTQGVIEGTEAESFRRRRLS